MKKPDFFIIGAPKCGTTSLATWLGEHPAIFMSPVKEPHYFNTDEARYIQTLASYEALFRDAGSQHQAVGEASVWYLYSENAVTNILDYRPDARFIVMIRNPVEMAPSLHEEMVFTGIEPITGFADAWRAQEQRREPGARTRFGEGARRLLYADACRLGAQIERLLRAVPRHRLHFVRLDDMKSDPRSAYLGVLGFLGVADDGRTRFEALNAAKRRRWPLLPLIGQGVAAIKRRLGIEGGLGIWSRIDARNVEVRPREALDQGIRSELLAFFAEDVDHLEAMLQLDLSAWRR